MPMSLALEHGLYLRIEEAANGPLPRPLTSGFNLDTAYRALGLYNPSESSEAYFIFSNDRDETWFICNRHVRLVALMPESRELRLALKKLHASLAMNQVGLAAQWA
jgi:hypothetical protein